MGSQIIVIMILVGVFIIAFGIYLVKQKPKTKGVAKKEFRNIKTTTGQAKNLKNNNVTAKETVVGIKKVAKEVPRKDMSEFIKFDKILNDMIYQNNGTKYTMILQCKGINYELMSDVEQMSVEEGFITFLNTLTAPIQLYVQSRSINLTENIRKYKERAQIFVDKSNAASNKYDLLEDDIDSSPEDLKAAKQEKLKTSNIVEYVEDITKYVEQLSINKYMLQRKFYIILSYYRSELGNSGNLSKSEYDSLCYRELYTRAQGITGSLAACSVSSRVLNSNELGEMLFIALNKDDEKLVDIKNALDSGFFRLYSTADDVREKRQKDLDDAILEESMIRIEDAIRDAIRDGVIVSQDELAESMDKEIDKSAIRTIEKSNVSEELKEHLKDNLLTKRKDRMKVRKKVKEAKDLILEKTQQVENEEVNENLVKEDLIKESADENINEESIINKLDDKKDNNEDTGSNADELIS